MNITLDEHFHKFFKNRDQKYSATIQGMVRFDYANPYNVTVLSNKEVKIYLNQQLVFSKPQETKDTQSFKVEQNPRHKLIHFEAFISDKEREPEHLG
jgi:outer membrane lipoprotein-sorting protein